ncbi:protein PIGMENT DEFECTIVE 338, chloroplastic-like [Silene latifolia]|uniref:protein PIGMENT DEFECTIVE 338, chloroplastic-like n=1 Tax=Silene latifolia TaxID=37657 RepID=UPI003D77E995
MPLVMKTISPFGLLLPINKAFLGPISLSLSKVELYKIRNRVWLKKTSIPQSFFALSQNDLVLRVVHSPFCYAKNVSEDLTDTRLPEESVNGKFADTEELELLDKPLPIPINDIPETEIVIEPTKPDKDEALEPFLKFFKSKTLEDQQVEDVSAKREMVSEKIIVEYYEPKPGDLVIGVVVSGNENKLDINVGADLLGTMLTKEVLPLYDKEMDYLLCDLDKNVEEFMANGKMGIVQKPDLVTGKPTSGRPIVDAGNVIIAEVLCRTLSGRPLLSSRRYFRRIAWHRVRQIEQLGEPIQVRITEWNTGGLLTRIEGLRAFLPKAELVEKVNSYADLKDKVGSKMYVQINRINEATNDLILSEREAWEKVSLREGALLEGTVRKIYPYGAQIRLGQTNRSGLLHASNISQGKFKAVSDVLTVGEKVKVLVIRSFFPDKISLSIADLESEPGLFISDKEKVFEEAEDMAKRYKRKHSAVITTRKFEPSPANPQLFDDEESVFANWHWFVFQRETEP